MGKVINAQGSKMLVDARKKGAAEAVWTKIRNVKTYSGFDGSAAEIDSTDLDSKAKEKMQGLMDNGGFTLDVNQNLDDAGQAVLLAMQMASETRPFILILPNGKATGFNAFVKTFPTAGGTDALITSSIALTLSGSRQDVGVPDQIVNDTDDDDVDTDFPNAFPAVDGSDSGTQ